nr:hypothetical protein [uncultured Pedobacter sp.]
MIKAFILSLLLLNAISVSYAQQSGNYTSVDLDVKVRSKDVSGNVVYSDWKHYETRVIDSLKDFKSAPISTFNKYGGDRSRHFKSTSYFRTEKVNGRWWVIDPLGNPGLNIAVNSITEGNSINNLKEFKNKFSSSKDWLEKTVKQLQEIGFNTGGSWSKYQDIIELNKSLEVPFSYTINLGFMQSYGAKKKILSRVPGHAGYQNNVIPVFDKEFETFCDEFAKKLVAYKNDPNLFGYFSDNEMPLNLKNLESYLAIKDKSDEGYIAAKEWIDGKGIDSSKITDKERAEFLAYVGNKYFSIVSRAIKKYDANHLFIGSRFYSGEKNVPEFMKVAGKYLDIISINYYGVWTPDAESMKQWADESGKPFIVTEFYTKAMDSGLPNVSGAGWQVKTQEDRGMAYQNFCLALLESKNCVGWHWFKYQDNDPTNTKSELSNTDANKGLVDNNYNFYLPLADKMKQLNLNRFKLIKYFDNN